MESLGFVLRFATILLITVSFLEPVGSVSCFSCAGRKCRSGKCEGDCCYSGHSPLGPYHVEAGGADYIKGCVSYEETGPKHCKHVTHYLPDVSEACNEDDFCNGDAEAISGRPPVLCRHGQDEKSYCEADWCYRGLITSKEDKPEPIFGCSGIGIGGLKKSFCIQPPIGPLLLNVPFIDLDPKQPVCFCRNSMCNNEAIPAKPDEDPVAEVEIWFDREGLVTGGKGGVWIEHEMDLPQPSDITIESYDFVLNISVVLTEKGEKLKKKLQERHLEKQKEKLKNIANKIPAYVPAKIDEEEEDEEGNEEGKEKGEGETAKQGQDEVAKPGGASKEGEEDENETEAQKQIGAEEENKKKAGKNNTAIIVVFVVIIIIILVVGIAWKLELPKKIMASRYSAVS